VRCWRTLLLLLEHLNSIQVCHVRARSSVRTCLSSCMYWTLNSVYFWYLTMKQHTWFRANLDLCWVCCFVSDGACFCTHGKCRPNMHIICAYCDLKYFVRVLLLRLHYVTWQRFLCLKLNTMHKDRDEITYYYRCSKLCLHWTEMSRRVSAALNCCDGILCLDSYFWIYPSVVKR